MKNGIKAAALTALMLPAAAMAEINYSYVEGGLALYPSADLGASSQTFIGGTARGSLELEAIDPNVFTFGGITFLTDDVDLTAFHVGGGYRFELDAQTDLWGGATIEYQEIDQEFTVCGFGGCVTRSASFDDTALGFRGGVRHMMDENVEVGGSARLVTGDLDYFGLAGTVRYHWRDNLNFLGEVDLYDGEFGVIGGVNYAF